VSSKRLPHHSSVLGQCLRVPHHTEFVQQPRRPSTSENTNVTVPVGRSSCTAPSIAPKQAHRQRAPRSCPFSHL
jgi:hypothetical protein